MKIFCNRRAFSHRFPHLLAVGAVGIAVLVSGGCKSGENGQSRTASRSSGAIRETPAIIAEADRTHVIGPTAAAEMNYRIAWQYLNAGRNVKQFTVQGDSVYVLDGQNLLTRIRIQDGNRQWRIQVAEPIEEVLGVTLAHERLYVTTGGAMLVLDPGTGSQIEKQPLMQIANTQPAVHGQYLIYGSRNGQVVWHSGVVGHHWRGYQVAHSIQIPPQLSNDYLVAIGNDGTIMVLNASSTRQYWSKILLAAVVSAPAVGDSATFIAGLDQYLWAFDLASGRNIWKVLTAAPLTDSPTLIEDRIYQQVPQHGLFCFEALPFDSPGGAEVWHSPTVKGNVIIQRRADLFVWDAPSRRMTLVDVARGSPIKTIDLPDVVRLIVAGENHDDIYALSGDGRVVRLVPRN